MSMAYLDRGLAPMIIFVSLVVVSIVMGVDLAVGREDFSQFRLYVVRNPKVGGRS